MHNPFSQFPSGPLYSGKFFDFHSDEEITEGVFTAISSGTNTVLDTVKHGVMRIASNGAADDSGGEWQVDAAGITLVAQKELLFISRHAINDVTQSDFRAGFATLDASWIASAPTNGIFFRSDDGDALLDLVIQNATVESVITGAATLADATYVELAIRVQMSLEAIGMAFYYVNGVNVGNIPLTIPSTAIMTCGVAGQSGAAASTTFDTDYLGWRQQR